MTTYILKLDAGQKIPRPMNEVGSESELVEILAHWVAYNSGPTLGAHRRAKAAGENAVHSPAAYAANMGLKLANVDTEEPILVWRGSKFWAFTEN